MILFNIDDIKHLFITIWGFRDVSLGVKLWTGKKGNEFVDSSNLYCFEKYCCFADYEMMYSPNLERVTITIDCDRDIIELKIFFPAHRIEIGKQMSLRIFADNYYTGMESLIKEMYKSILLKYEKALFNNIINSYERE